ncbi:MAG: glycosyltransferase [Lachnospiraceae bacterium]|nr:glycosyltransferase [Lachnospiraceae bacterium]
MKKVSVIVPMYNSENTIDECLMSLTSQSIFNDMELLIVDDCSKDNSVLKAAAFEERYPDNIMLIKLSENGGPGRARNIAMEYAQGEYIGFVDSDDAVVPVMYEHLYEEAVRCGADVVDGGIYEQNTDNAIVYTSDDLSGKPDNEKISRLIVSGGYICSKIFRREFLISEGISFREEYVLEDLDYILEVFCKMKMISNVKEIVYVYRDSGDSLSKTVDVDKYLHSTVTAMRSMHEKLFSLPFYEGIREAVEYVLVQLYSFSINVCLKAIREGTQSKEKTLDSLRDLKALKRMLVKGDYDNRFILDKIGRIDIEIMQQNDDDPERLIARIGEGV